MLCNRILRNVIIHPQCVLSCRRNLVLVLFGDPNSKKDEITHLALDNVKVETIVTVSFKRKLAVIKVSEKHKITRKEQTRGMSLYG